MTHEVLIIGAGAAGLISAIGAAERGRSVTVIDHNPIPGRKLRATGGGRCNFSNSQISPAFYVSTNPHFVKSALARFKPQQFTAMLDRSDIAWEEREHGRLFCMGSAVELTNMLYEDALRARVKFIFGVEVTGAEHKSDGFVVHANNGQFKCKSLVVATGGMSFAELGASGIGIEIARGFGAGIIPPRPALVPFTLAKDERELWGELSGISHRVTVTCPDGRAITDDLLVTHKGFSGPAALRASLRWAEGKPLYINFIPSLDLAEAIAAASKLTLKTMLGRCMSQRLADLLCGDMGMRRVAEMSKKDISALSERLRRWEITPAGVEGWGKAEVTRGGVSTDEVSSKTFEFKRIAGLYFIGEVLDVTGDLGGYNLHWAWASGHAAGLNV